jgi:hypothetical protein
MNNLFNKTVRDEVINRFNKITPETKGQWGVMSSAQMLAHCSLPLELVLTNPKPPRVFLGRIMGPMIKNAVIGPKPFKKNGYTPPMLKITEPQDFNTQKEKVLGLLNRFTPENLTDKVHPFFGKMTEDEWGQSQYKHLNHHLTQFGV